MIVQTNPANIDASGISVDITPPTAGTIQSATVQVGESANLTVAAGAYSVVVYNNNLEPITVNGETLEPGDHKPFEARLNPVLNKFDFCPAVNIITPAGGSAYYVTERPS